MAEQVFEGWAILELMGHRKLAGYLRAEELAGAAFIRIDVPADGDHNIATQFYAPAAVYCITPTTEELARRIANGVKPEPVTRWELPSAQSPPLRVTVPDVDDEDDYDDAGEPL